VWGKKGIETKVVGRGRRLLSRRKEKELWDGKRRKAVFARELE
jgi:hypothetical protein